MAITAILAFLAAFTGAFFGTLLARTERRIPVIQQVKDVVQGEPQETKSKRILEEYLYGAPKGGGG